MIQIKQISREHETIELAWCDKTSFEDIFNITGLREPDVIRLMRRNMKPSSFRLWRKRVSGRAAKHRVKTRCSK
ncbi:MAG: TIGR03643 family protein [Thalassobaculaceae bacterium]